MCKVLRAGVHHENAMRRPLQISELQCQHTWLVVGIEGVTFLRNDFLHQAQGTPKVHVVAYTLGLPTEHGCVASEACLELCLSQKIHPDHLACTTRQLHTDSCDTHASYGFEDNEEAKCLRWKNGYAKVI